MRSKLAALLLAATLGCAADLSWAEKLVSDVEKASFPELSRKRIEIRPFTSESDYFQSRFRLGRFVSGLPMRYEVFVNTRLDQAAPGNDALKAVIAHELSHVLYYSRGPRIRLLGLVRLTRRRFTIRFEHGADLEAIRRGFGPGLIAYREWLYTHIPASKVPIKKRNYYTPEEIRTLVDKLPSRP